MLGRKEAKRFPALPSPVLGEGPISLVEAWDELSHAEFALWCRLCAEPPDSLYQGRKYLAVRMGYSYRRFAELIRKLVARKYLKVVEATSDDHKAVIMIERRGVIGHKNSFLRLKA